MSEVRDAVERMFAAANRGDYEAADTVFTADFRSHPLGTTGIPPIRDSWRAMFTRFPGLRVVPQRMISDGDRVAVWSKIENMPGTPELMELIRVRDGRVAELWALGTIRQNLGMRLEPMTEARYQTYYQEQLDSYATSVEKSGVPRDEAVRRSKRDSDRLLTEGRQTPDHHLLVAWDGDEEVGHIWIKLTDRRAYVYDFGVPEHLRRQGYGRATMELAEQWCREQGATEIGLHVFAHNPGARRLYEQLGFQETGRLMDKRL
ncbi:GNAT family N-acetyltransferase [Actinoplanes sp. NPDC051411]|uniref:GNAT family N-acetyltransferase n=1 Tax=Actinoplanes sp. NPDC051411 TaxID=3155522 RepID=UPI0034391DA0